MVKKIFYNASFPRSGSTILQNVMMQNPDIYSTPTSGVIELLTTARTIYSTGDAFKAQDQELMRRGFQNFCKEGLYGFFNGVTDRPYVIDKSRAWAGNWRFLNFIEENPKIIVMVRDLRAVFASMEKNYRKHPDKDPLIVNSAELTNMTPESRLVHFSNKPPIGPSVEWLKDVIQQGLAEKIHFIRFEDLCQNPEAEMVRLYKYLDIPYYQHDFDNVEQLTWENDVIHGIFGDHQIKTGKLELPKENWLEILGEVNSNSIVSSYGWFFKTFNYTI
jgi:sulfotransferase